MENTGIRKTHPLVLGAAASVMVVSLVGAVAIGERVRIVGGAVVARS